MPVEIHEPDPLWPQEFGESLAAAGWQQKTTKTDHVVLGEPTDPAQWQKRLAVEPPGQRRVNCHLRIAGQYADLKDPVCDLIYPPAREWAAPGWMA